MAQALDALWNDQPTIPDVSEEEVSNIEQF